MSTIPRALAVLVLALSSAVVPASAAGAQPGALDSGFGSGGLASAGSGQLFGVAVAPSGEIVAVGRSGGSILVQRFSSTGSSNSRYVGAAGAARAVAIQSDGKFVVAGYNSGMFVERFNADGSVDGSFGSSGVAHASPLGSSSVGNAVAVQPDGKIVVAGCDNATECTPDADTRIAVARFNSNGSLDSSFGSGGTEVLNSGPAELGLPAEEAGGVAVQPDGKIVLAGREQGSPNFVFFNGMVVRLNSNGSLDSSFAGSGVISYHKPGGGYDSFNGVAVQNDGKLVIGGLDVESSPEALVLRLNQNGSPDSSFGSGGLAAQDAGIDTSSGDPIGAYGVAIAGGGHIVEAGSFEDTSTDVDAAAWSFSPTGAADASFGSGGVARGPGGANEACAVAVAPDGGVISVGGAVPSLPDANPCFNNDSSSAFVTRRVGYGPPPPPVISGPPSATTGAASAVTEVSATVSGQVTPDGLPTSYHFDYGTANTYGSSTPQASAASASAPASVSADLAGLTPGTTYHYRLVAQNSDGTATGSDATFTTASAGPGGTTAPSLTEGAASRIGETTAKLSGAVSSGGLPTTYHFEYGPSSSYGAKTNESSLAAAASAANVSATLTGLQPGTTYHYRLVAHNAAGTTFGADKTFTTLPRVALSVLGLKRVYGIGAVERRPIGLRIGCSQACSIQAVLVVTTATVRKLKLGKRQIVLARGSSTLRRAGTAKIQLRLSGKDRRTLARVRQLGVQLQVSATPTGGGPTVRAKKGFTLKR